MFQRIKSVIGLLLSIGVSSVMAENNSKIDVNNPELVNAMARAEIIRTPIISMVK